MGKYRKSILGAIRQGLADDDLEDILAMVLWRRKTAGQIRAAGLKVGDRVQLIEGIRPTYLAGLPGKIVEVRRTKFVIALDDGPMGRFRGGRLVCNPASFRPIE